MTANTSKPDRVNQFYIQIHSIKPNIWKFSCFIFVICCFIIWMLFLFSSFPYEDSFLVEQRDYINLKA